MKIKFSISCVTAIIDEATHEDMKTLMKVREIESHYDDKPIVYKSRPREIAFYADDDVAIVGLCDEANKEQISTKIKELEVSVEQYRRWWLEEQKKTEELTKKIED